MLAAVHHPNIVRLFGVSTDNVDRCCIVLEYAPLGCLRTVLDGGPLTEDSREMLMGGIVRGMAHLHSREPPLLHHDLKPSNVLVFDCWTAKLTDFGIATGTGLSTFGAAHRSVAPTAGTFQYRAPELEPSTAFDGLRWPFHWPSTLTFHGLRRPSALAFHGLPHSASTAFHTHLPRPSTLTFHGLPRPCALTFHGLPH